MHRHVGHASHIVYNLADGPWPVSFCQSHLVHSQEQDAAKKYRLYKAKISILYYMMLPLCKPHSVIALHCTIASDTKDAVDTIHATCTRGSFLSIK